ncbi:MAG: DUF4139 domain-containing protein [Sulfitobacter sp.]
MRLLLVGLIALPSFASAESFSLSTAPNAVTVYGDGAVVTREVSVKVPSGSHELILPGLPQGIDPQYLRVSLKGAILGQTQFRTSALPPQGDVDSAEVTAAKDAIKAAEMALRQHDDGVALTGLAGNAAQAKVQFLAALGQNEALPTDPESLRGLAQMIEDETLIAQQNLLAAVNAARDQNDAREDLEKQLQDARDTLAALTPPPLETSLLTLSIATQDASDVTVTLTYLVHSASWHPVYDAYLSGTDSPEIELRRGALVTQYSDENWNDVAMTLSTLQPSSDVSPREIYPMLRRIVDKEPPRPQVTSRLSGSIAASPEPMMEADMILEAPIIVSFDGPGVTYNATDAVSVATGAEATRVPLGTLTFDAERVAVAVPRYDQTAFLMARFTNTTKEPLLAAETASLYIDNTFVGVTGFAQVPAGAEADLPFGPIEALRLSRTILDENNGDRGFISRTNAQTEQARLNVENIGAVDWQVEVIDNIPYTIDEYLEITWTASPEPDVIDVDDKRGVLQWNVTAPAGMTTSIKVDHDLQWPTDKVLR